MVQPGSSGIMLSALTIQGLLHFPASDPAVTSHCSFFHIVGAHVLFEGQVSDLQFIGMTNLGASLLSLSVFVSLSLSVSSVSRALARLPCLCL